MAMSNIDEETREVVEHCKNIDREWCPYISRESRISTATTSSRSIAPPAITSALLTRGALLKLGLSPATKVLD
jgi:hypothetical protein